MQISDLESAIYTFVVDNFMFGQTDGLGSNESLLERGVINSTGVLELITFLEENFMITVKDDEVIPANLETISSIAAFVTRKRDGMS